MNYFGSASLTLILFFLYYISKQLIKNIVHIYDTIGISAGKLKLFTCFSTLIGCNVVTPIPLLPSCPVY